MNCSKLTSSSLFALLLCVLIGCGNGGSGSSGSSSSSSEPQILLSSSSLTFSGTSVNSSSAAQTVTVQNVGNGNLTLSSVVLSDTTNYALTNGCSSTLAAGASCTLSVVFQPKSTGTLAATVRITDNSQNVSGNYQDITLSGNATTAALPAVTLSASSLSFVTTTVGSSTTLSVTLTNSGTSALTFSGAALSGTNSAQFSTSNTCSTTVAAAGSCTISVTFTPTAASTYTATLTLTDNANGVSGSTQTVSLSGSGTTTASAVTYKLYLMPDPGTGQPGGGMTTALYALVDNATSTVDITMYALQDSSLLAKMVTACGRGVKVRAVLDQNNEKSNNATAYSTLNSATNCSAVWANTAFQVTHEKAMVVDNTTLVLMTGNLQSQYYSTGRDYQLFYNDPVDVAAVEATFNMDYAAGTPSTGVAGTSDYSYLPGAGTDLIWSPTTAKAKMESIINNATTTLIVENEELTSSATYIVSDLIAACTRGVTVKIMIENEGGSYTSSLNQLKSGGCTNIGVYTSSTGFYVHAKAVVADYGLSTQNAYMGSINYSNASMTANRELGLNVADQATVNLIYTTFTSDYNSATKF